MTLPKKPISDDEAFANRVQLVLFVVGCLFAAFQLTGFCVMLAAVIICIELYLREPK